MPESCPDAQELGVGSSAPAVLALGLGEPAGSKGLQGQVEPEVEGAVTTRGWGRGKGGLSPSGELQFQECHLSLLGSQTLSPWLSWETLAAKKLNSSLPGSCI